MSTFSLFFSSIDYNFTVGLKSNLESRYNSKVPNKGTMTRIRKVFTKEMLIEQFNQVLISKGGDNGKNIGPLSRSEDSKFSAEQTKRKQRKRKNENIEERPMKKKQELEWKPENRAQPIGKFIKFTGAGVKKKCHYEKFEFHGIKYELVSFVFLKIS